MPERKKKPFTCSIKQEAGRGWRINCSIDGKHYRPRFKTRALAVQEKKRLLELHGNVGRSGGALLAEHQEDAANALKILQPHSGKLTEAAQFYVDRYLKFSSNKTFFDYAEELVEKLHKKRRKPKTIASLKDRTKAMLQAFGNTVPRDLPPEKFVDWFWKTANEGKWVEETMYGTKRKCSQLFRFIIKAGGLESNPCELLDLPDKPERKVEIYSLQQVAQLLYHAPEFGLQNYLALGFFGGLRPEEEAFHLRLEDFYFDTNQLFVPERLGKTSSRSVEIQPVLLEWLKKYLPEKDPVTDPVNFRKRREALCKKTKIKWIYDGVRHTFGSMMYADTGDKQYTIDQMGHRDDDKIFNDHYKRLVSRNRAEYFWKFTPDTVKQLVAGRKRKALWGLIEKSKSDWRSAPPDPKLILQLEKAAPNLIDFRKREAEAYEAARSDEMEKFKMAHEEMTLKKK
ncbi:MAG: site-specific integrase [Flavobacteriaceae bacterium]|nr:site-specific integrase [Flavobacteriaceae bacterium]